MAKHTYTVASQEGVDRYGGEIGDTVEVDLDVDAKRAVVAAGWLEPHDEESKDDKKPKEANK